MDQIIDEFGILFTDRGLSVENFTRFICKFIFKIFT